MNHFITVNHVMQVCFMTVTRWSPVVIEQQNLLRQFVLLIHRFSRSPAIKDLYHVLYLHLGAITRQATCPLLSLSGASCPVSFFVLMMTENFQASLPPNISNVSSHHTSNSFSWMCFSYRFGPFPEYAFSFDELAVIAILQARIHIARSSQNIARKAT